MGNEDQGFHSAQGFQPVHHFFRYEEYPVTVASTPAFLRLPTSPSIVIPAVISISFGVPPFDDEVTLTTRQDTDGIYNMIKNFFKEYNSLINEMDKLYNAEFLVAINMVCVFLIVPCIKISQCLNAEMGQIHLLAIYGHTL